MDPNALPSRPHLERIRRELWCRRGGHGRAAVMVGAGFSRNAEPLGPSSGRFPLWSELGARLYRELHPAGSIGDSDDKRRLALAGNGPVRLASEFAAAYGRAELDRLARESIPNDQYDPVRLHRLLLSLPWSDVFTTNYDTLLERTRRQVHHRRYELVQAAEDLPGAMKPRIVKLHGSFPSQRPFILTEEDYRTYPVESSPFVNSVQQAMLENTFCLLGFSGDDPNFLFWSGWVRDHLGRAAPRIYLCGLLDLTDAQRLLLEQRNVVPVDVSPLFTRQEWPDIDVRHAKATEWLLLNLLGGEPADPLRWPSSHQPSVEAPSTGLPALLPPPHAGSGPGPFPRAGGPSPADLIELRKQWQAARAAYPGWVIAPTPRRQMLWLHTDRWIDAIFHHLDALPAPENLLLLHELNWRLERTLTPLLTGRAGRIGAVLETFAPRPGVVDLPGARHRPDAAECQGWDWNAIGNAWTELAFAVARQAREELDAARHRLWTERLQAVGALDVQVATRLCYERALFSLWELDFASLRAVLADWPAAMTEPFWDAKRAALLAESGSVDEALRLAEGALAAVRSRQVSGQEDIALLSQEGWIIRLLGQVKLAAGKIRIDPVGGARDRYDQLEHFHCNPSAVLEEFESGLRYASPPVIPVVEEVSGFDPAHISVVWNSQPGLNPEERRTAFALLRLCEEAAAPLRFRFLSLLDAQAASAALRIEDAAPDWAFSTMVRSGQEKTLLTRYDRVRIATLDTGDVDRLFGILQRAMAQALAAEARHDTHFSRSVEHLVFPQVVELLSRLCIRLRAEQLDAVFALAVAYYRSPLSQPQHDQKQGMAALFKRLLSQAMPSSQVIGKLRELLALPLAGEDGTAPMESHEVRSDPLISLLQRDDAPSISDEQAAAWNTPVQHLLQAMREGSAAARANATVRLAVVHDLRALTAEQEEAFGTALWARLDAGTGLPADTSLTKAAVLTLPKPGPESAADVFRRYVAAAEFPRVVTRSVGADGREVLSFPPIGRHNRVVYDVLQATRLPIHAADRDRARTIVWSREESERLLEKAVSWWAEERGYLNGSMNRPFMFGNLADRLRTQFADLVDLLADAILPNLQESEEGTKESALRLLAELQEAGIAVHAALPSKLRLRPEAFHEVAEALREASISAVEEVIAPWCAGLLLWLIDARGGSLPPPPPDLLQEWINKIVTRRPPALFTVLGHLAQLIDLAPDLFSAAQRAGLCTGLSYLLAETALPPLSGQLGIVADTAGGGLAVAQRPLYRQYSAALASALERSYQASGEAVPPILARWREAGSSDALPEVRKVYGG